jgi:hypothetical protein
MQTFILITLRHSVLQWLVRRRVALLQLDNSKCDCGSQDHTNSKPVRDTTESTSNHRPNCATYCDTGQGHQKPGLARLIRLRTSFLRTHLSLVLFIAYNFILNTLWILEEEGVVVWTMFWIYSWLAYYRGPYFLQLRKEPINFSTRFCLEHKMM